MVAISNCEGGAEELKSRGNETYLFTGGLENLIVSSNPSQKKRKKKRIFEEKNQQTRFYIDSYTENWA